MEIKSGIYKIVNNVNNKIYVGSAVDFKQRKANHFSMLNNLKHNNRKLQNSVNKHGINNFEFIIIEYVNNLDILLDREQYFLNNLLKANEDNNYFNENGYNLLRTAHNSRGYIFTEERLEKMSRNRIDKKLQNQIYNKIENIDLIPKNEYTHTKKVIKNCLSDSGKTKLSSNLKRLRTENPEVFAVCMKGKNHSDEAKKKIGFTL